MIRVYCYEKCSTCWKARSWLRDHDIEHEVIDIKGDHPDADALQSYYELSGLPLKKFFNTSGNLYKDLHLKDKLPTMSDDEQFALLATDGMLVKRPILITGDTVLVGFKEAEYQAVLK